MSIILHLFLTDRMKLIVAAASELKCDYIFLSTSGRRLAAQLITDMAQGKGNQIHLETVSFESNHFLLL